MKNKIDRTQTGTKMLSTRAIALVLCCVMLLTAIGSGSVLNAFALNKAADTADDTAVVETVDEVAEELTPADIYDTEQTMLGVTKSADTDDDTDEGVIAKKGDTALADTGANADIADTGYTDGGYVKGSWGDNWAKHDITSGYTISLAADTTYEFCFVAKDNEDTFKKDVTISGSVTKYDFPKDGTTNAKLHTTVAGNYTFKFNSWDGGQTSMRVDITFPEDTTPDTWTAAGAYGTSGSSDAGFFGTAWAASATANDLTNTSGTTWSKTWSNVTLSAQKTIYYKVVKNHSWDTAYPSENETKTIPAGTYNITITYNSSTNAVNLTYTSVAKSTLKVANVANATVTATYNGKTAQEGGTITDIPQGATVTVSVTPESGYKCAGITSTVAASTSGSGRTWYLTMPGSATTVDANITTVSTKKVYFNNSYTGYGQIYAYVYNKNGSTITDKYLGSYPGTTMTKLDNSNIWYIEVPEDITYINFVSGDGYSTGEMEIPWGTYTYPKYTAPYGHNDAPTEKNGGTWGNYKWGSSAGVRDNVYTVSDGSTMNASNLFTGITATMYDYYVDGEIGTKNGGWLKGIQSDEYNMGTNWKWDPYTVLNKNLSAYADTTNSPKYDVTYPLYFGNLNVPVNQETTNDLTKNYYHFNRLANNSEALKTNGKNYDAVTGLTGKTLAGSTIHYYKNGATNENGAPLAMFDEDFLSGENKTGDTLATILRTSSFPVRTEDNVKSLCLDLSSATSWEGTGNVIVANFYNNSTTESGALRLAMTSIGNHKYTVKVPSGYTKVEWLKFTNTDISGNAAAYNNGGAFSSWNTFKSKSATNNAGGNTSTDSTLAKGHTYYEYDSTNGKDNAFITNIDTTNKTANIDYYADSEKYVQSNTQTKGFFPFDYNNVISGTAPTASRVYLNPDTNWTSDGAWFAAVFKVDGKGDSWITLTKDTTLNLWYVDVPAGYETGTVDFCRMNKDYKNKTLPSNPWDAKWNDTGFLSLPTNDKVVCKITTDQSWDNKGSWTSNSKITVTYTPVNNYADTTNHYAHDQGFGMKLTIPFNLGTNGLNEDGTPQTFDFSGDDDLWVFIDNKLVLDLGGAHAATTGSINFNTKTITASNTQAIASGVSRNGSFDGLIDTSNVNYVHTMTIYYMERGMFDSNLKFGFSFHAIPNQFWVDKKIRTRNIINSGFYTDNGQTGTASNKNAAMSESEGRFISNFEKSYQDEGFTVEQKVKGGSAESKYSQSEYQLLNQGTRYTVDNDSTVYYTETNNNLPAGQYPIYHDLGNAFIGQFSNGDTFNLKETSGDNNKYVYTPVFSAWDQANNDKNLNPAGNNTDGYTFTFAPTTTVQTAIENLNIKARFENYMKAHTLTLQKEITNATDTESSFNLQILFDFDYDGENGFDQYIAYPLNYMLNGEDLDSNGNPYKLSGNGIVTLTAGDVIQIPMIPEKAKIKVVEVLDDTVDGYRYVGATLTQNGTTVEPSTVTKGITFTMGDDDMTAVFSNKKPDYKYTIKYTYQSYDNLYGNQSYTVSGVFTENELKTYLKLNDSGALEFRSVDLKKGFINRKAPLEDNFMQILSFADSEISGENWNDGNYSCEVTATATTNDQISVSFKLPYAVIASDAASIDKETFLVPKEGAGGKVAKITAQTVGTRSITCFDWYVTDGKSRKTADWTADQTAFVNAPLIIYDSNNTAYYFNYWSVKKASSYGMKEAEYTRCYDYEFNYSLFMDSVIEPVYATSWAQSTGAPTTYDMYERYDPELQIVADMSNRGIGITFLENSRNQYNNSDDGTTTSRNKGAAADVIYSDFLLSFNYVKGYEQLNQREEGKTKAGIVIEAVGYLDGNNMNGFDTSVEYRNETNKPTEETKKAAIKTWVEGGATNQNRPSGMAVSQFDVTQLDNKNCAQYYYSLNNRKLDASTGNLLNTLQNRYKVFRAYAYIGDVDGNKLKDVIVSDPVYFTIYDMASNGLTDNASIN